MYELLATVTLSFSFINFFFLYIEIAVATNTVWAEISSSLGSKISKSAIHTLVYKDRYNVKEKLGFQTCPEHNIMPNVVVESLYETG